jgi:hypothetical protein
MLFERTDATELGSALAEYQYVQLQKSRWRVCEQQLLAMLSVHLHVHMLFAYRMSLISHTLPSALPRRLHSPGSRCFQLTAARCRLN